MGTKGDLFDGYLWKAELAQREQEPEQISDYPEHVVDVLRGFYRVFNLPEGAIPSKGKKGYSNWVLQLESISRLFSSNKTMLLAMNRSKKIYDGQSNKFIIYEPASIRKLLIESIRQLREEMKNAPKLEEPRKEATKEEKMKVIRELKNLFKED